MMEDTIAEGHIEIALDRNLLECSEFESSVGKASFGHVDGLGRDIDSGNSFGTDDFTQVR